MTSTPHVLPSLAEFLGIPGLKTRICRSKFVPKDQFPKGLEVPTICRSPVQIQRFVALIGKLLEVRRRGHTEIPAPITPAQLDEADHAQEAISRNWAIGLQGIDGFETRRILASLAALAKGWDGESCLSGCSSQCEGKIRRERTIAMPDSPLCLHCQQVAECDRLTTVAIRVGDWSDLVVIRGAHQVRSRFVFAA
jgi:RNA polymerase-binding transcription factor DksA